ncbi:hypothetical protein F2Q70_00026094 [Brassica cretica]|uniref:Uncharacterized protein n=1 Tax=Brassica cretica TaxID=69181 RepID=A0A8S9LHX8_BRACR|nr:hypothetical protein F2Q70_00026094 [Brassica cretica]
MIMFTLRRLLSLPLSACLLPRRLAPGSSWMYVSIFFRIVGLIAGIQVDTFDCVDPCILYWGQRVFGISSFDRRYFARVLPCGMFPRSSRPVVWGCEVESSSAYLC